MDDGSCLVMGCTDSRNPHYDPLATDDDGSCLFIIEGCTYPGADNYRPDAVLDDGACLVPGCTDSRHSNYNPHATYSDGSCPFLPEGCTDSLAINFGQHAVLDDGSCRYAQPVDPAFFEHVGCMDWRATNYLQDANVPGECSYAGCMQSDSVAYKSVRCRALSTDARWSATAAP
jgi:hypothetical protein